MKGLQQLFAAVVRWRAENGCLSPRGEVWFELYNAGLSRFNPRVVTAFRQFAQNYGLDASVVDEYFGKSPNESGPVRVEHTIGVHTRELQSGSTPDAAS